MNSGFMGGIVENFKIERKPVYIEVMDLSVYSLMCFNRVMCSCNPHKMQDVTSTPEASLLILSTDNHQTDFFPAD